MAKVAPALALACCSLFLLCLGCHTERRDRPALARALEPEAARYLADLRFIAAAPRARGTEHHGAVQDLCATRLAALGYEVERHHYGTGVNVVGRLGGIERPDELIVVSAHYDSVPDCNGANDNGTGVAGLLETARVLAAARYPRTLVIGFWDGEELGLQGSRCFARRARKDNASIVAVYVYEQIGYRSKEPNSQRIPPGFNLLYPSAVQQVQANRNRGDFVCLVYDAQTRGTAADVADLLAREGLPALQLEVGLKGIVAPDLWRSDHAAFWQQGYPAMMVTDTAEYRNPGYHCLHGSDDLDVLDHDFAVETVAAVTASAGKALGKAD